MRKILVYWPVALLVVISCVYYWKLFRGDVPFPGDLLIGAYLPWLEYKWGNIVGVAIKNTLISDIFSQFFLWKNEIARNYLQGQWPLWNPYSYSGYPLLANFNSGALNPLNVLMVIFGSVNGWSLFVFTQTVGCAIAMYTYLRICNREKMASVIAATVYAFGGFSVLWSQFVNVGFAMIWIPLVLATIEKTRLKKNSWYLLLVAPLFLLIVLAGHLQALIYAAVITIFYFIYRLGIKNWSYNLSFLMVGLLAVAMSAIQLFPTIELMNRSIRFADTFTDGINYGLLPWRNLITLVAPDFFGNPATGNFWGFFDYHETMTYVSVLGVVGLFFGLFQFRKLAQGKFFVFLALLALLLQFDTPLGVAIYKYKAPFLYTSVAGRVNMVLLLATSVLVAEMVECIKKINLKQKTVIFLPTAIILLTAGALSYGFLKLGWQLSWMDKVSSTNMAVAMRNLIVPTILCGSLFLVVILSNRIKPWKWLVLSIVVADLFRFGWKYIPFVPKAYVYPETEVISFIKKDHGVFRIEKELGEILPQNTWTAYQLMSPSGYDPMAIETYVKAFSHDLNHVEHPGVTRFSEINTYDAKALGKYNVKYLLAIKRDKEARLGGNNLNQAINQKEWKKVFETKMVTVLENKDYKERARVIYKNGEEARGEASIASYENNKVVVNFKNVDGDLLLLTDTFYPGWTARLNGVSIEISDQIVPFRAISIKDIKEGEIVFEYRPKSFYVGLWVSLASFITWIVLFSLGRKRV